MNRRELFRISLAGSLGATAAAREFPANFDDSKTLARADWKPAFLSAHQNQTLVALGELIIPETDTAGATTALVNRFIDLLLAAETHDTQQSFLNSLAYVDGEARSKYGNAFVYLTPESQTELLTFFAYSNSLDSWNEGKPPEDPGHTHFQNLKGWVSRAYFSSEAGMKALGWNGEAAHGEFTGCAGKQG